MTTAWVTGFTPGGYRNDLDVLVGCWFTVGAANLTVTSLGRNWNTGNTQTHVLQIVDANTLSVVATATVDASLGGPTNDTFQYVALGSSVVLLAGQDYYLVSEEHAGGDLWHTDAPCSVVSADAALNGSEYYLSGSWHFVQGGYAFVPCDFLYTTGGGPAPTVTSVSPSRGATAGGTAVTITGTGFSTTILNVTFDGVSPTSIVRVNANTITCITPAGLASAVDVTVTNDDSQTGTGIGVYIYTDIVIVQHASSVSEAFTTTTTATLSSPATAGNTLVAECVFDKNCGAITVPAGFTEVGTQHNTGPSISFAMAYKVATGGETALTATCANAGVSKPGLTIIEIAGLKSTAPFDQALISYVDDANVTSRMAGPVTTTSAYEIAIAVYAIDTVAGINTGSGAAWDSGFSLEFVTPSSIVAGGSGCAVGSKILFTAGAVSSTFSYTPGAADQALGAIITLIAAPPAPNAVKWGLAYPPTTTSVKFSAELTSPSTTAQFQVLDYGSLAVIASSSAASTDAQNIFQDTVTGLTPNTRYKWRVTGVNGQDTAFTGSFYTAHTAGTSLTYDIVLGSDDQILNNDFSTYPRMAAVGARLFFSVGDHPYIDESGNVPATFRSKYRTLLENASFRTLSDVTPYAYIYDDHDFGGNDCDSTSASAPAVHAEYRRFYPVISYPDAGAQYHSFVFGKVRHVFMDLRAERLNGTRIMAPTQLQWVKDQLLAARNNRQVVILHSSSPVIATDPMVEPDTWAPYAVTRTAIMDYAQTLGMQLSVMWHHADAHMLAYDNGTNGKFSTDASFGWPLLCAAAISQNGSVKGGPYSGGTNPGTDQYGRLTITEDSSNAIGIRIRGVKSDDSNFVDQTITLNAGAAPTVTSVSASSGTTAGGTAVTITGTGFYAVTGVTFGGVAATSVVTVSATSITCSTPAHAAGAVNVVVTNADSQTGTLVNGYTYTAPAPGGHSPLRMSMGIGLRLS